MFTARPTAPQWIGLILIWLGGVAAARWIFQWDMLGNVIPGFSEMGIVAPTLFVCAGTALWRLGRHSISLRSNWAEALFFLCLAIVVTFPTLMLVEHVTGVSLGVDIVHDGVRPSRTSPFPGRMSPNACLGFLLGGVSLILQSGRRTVLSQRLSLVCLLGTAAIGTAGCVGYFLRLEVLYTLSSANRLTLPVAYGLVFLGAGLWHLGEQRSVRRTFERHESRITKRSVAVVALVALAAGVAGFATVEKSFEEVQAKTLVVTATTNARSLANALDVALWFPRTLATRPTVTQTLSRLDQQPNDAAARDFLTKVGDSFLSAGITSVRFWDQKGRLVVASGAALAPLDTASFSLTNHPQAKVLWRDGYLLHVEEPVLDTSGHSAGRVVTEQRLPLFDELLAEIRDGNAASDALICSRGTQDAAFCGPSRVRPVPFSLPLRDANGQANFAVLAALRGKAGSALTKDLRGVQVLAAVAPVGTYGLGLVVKTDVDGLYAPLRERLNFLGLLLFVLVAAGTLALRSLVKPLVAQVVDEQRRTRVILENSNDAFIGLNAAGLVTDWNGEAERTFGWTPAEAIGRNLAELIIPPGQRPAHDAGMARFRTTGTGPVVNRRIEVSALHRAGHQFTAELSVAAFAGEGGYVAHAFVRDITERIAAQSQLAASEKRLQAITDNLPVLISYIDKAHNVTFVNKTLLEWTGQDNEAAVGRPIKEVLGSDLYGHRVAHLNRALGGHRVEFEWVSEGVTATRDVHTVYIPDVLPDGTVAGVYSLSSDVTSAKIAQKHLDQLARMDPLTGLPNRREFEERLEKAMARCRRTKRPMALVFLDLDHFKDINDAHGHGIGDEVLKEFADRLDQCVRVTDTVARLAGDEFVVILESLNSTAEVTAISEKLGDAIRQPMRVESLVLTVTVSMGSAFYEGVGGDADTLVARADRALYRAKAAGRDTFAATTF